MAKNINYVSHKKSKVKINGKPQLPSADSLVEGEIAVNFAENVETLSIKNESGAVVTFSSDNYYSEQKLGSAFTGANSAVTVTDELSNKANTSDIANFFDDAKYEDSGTTKVINFYHGNTIKATIDATDFIVDGMVDDVRIENGNLVIDFNTASGKQDISIPLTDIFDPSNYYDKDDIDDLIGSGFTSSSITDVIIENEEIVSNALTDLDERKLDASAYTPTDLSNYYTKSETSGATEIANALSGKSNTGHTHDDRYYTESELTGSSTTVVVAKANSASTVPLAGVTNADDLKAIEALSGNNGLLKKTAANTWTLDTNTYSTTASAVTSGVYNSTNQKIELKNASGTVVSSIDATDFIKDGMISGVTLESKSGTTYLVINWNTDAGIQTTELNIGDIFEADNYYTKSETSGATEIANALSGKANVDDVEEMEETLVASITDIESRMAEKTALSALADEVNEVKDEVDNKLDITAYTPTTLLEEITYSALKSKRYNGELVQGQWYRITDYTCTTTQENTQSAGHVFDIIVRADDVNVLNENAYAAKHSGDTYFTNASAKLNAWELKYSLDNDTTKYYWADSTNGKGVIYYMKDEWNNECPYDFKNIQFKRYKITACAKSPDLIGLYSTTDIDGITVDTATTYWSYTFCMYDLNESAPCDVSTYQDKYYGDEGFCYKNYNNVFKSYLEPLYDEDGLVPMKLLDNVFITDTDICAIEGSYGEFYGFYSNTFGNDCGGNTFGNYFQYNTFGNSCNRNTFGNGCSNNTFGNNIYNNTFGNNNYNNTFGNDCYYNSFGNDCYYNSFGNSCSNNTFGNNNYNNTFGNSCQHIAFSKDYCYYNIVENGNQYITLTSTQTTSGSNLLRNITITQGVNNTSTLKKISHNTVNDTFKTTYQNSSSTAVNI